MAKDLARNGSKELSHNSQAIRKVDAGAAPKTHAKKAAAKHAAKKHAKKAAKHVEEHASGLNPPPVDDIGLNTAFHHMQRASAVISLMEKSTGEDLRDLLERGVKLYCKALDDGGGRKKVLRAIGVLRAAEHLSMAGLYAARDNHRQKVPSPGPKWLEDFIAQTDHRLERIQGTERGKGLDLFPVTVELLRQAEDADHDAHLAYELAMAADALCLALENGL